jgi:hypothetical protein
LFATVALVEVDGSLAVGLADEKGFADPEEVDAEEKGFADEDKEDFAPNRTSPRYPAGAAGALPFGAVLFCFRASSTLLVRIARNALTLPSFLLQGFRLQPRT